MAPGYLLTRPITKDCWKCGALIYSVGVIRGPVTRDVAGRFAITQGSTPLTRHSEETTKQVTFREPVSNTEMDDPDVEANHNERQSPANWVSGNSPYTAPLDDPGSSYSPFLPPVLEEPSSSFSEGNSTFLLGFSYYLVISVIIIF